MELKASISVAWITGLGSLNRTFYGIESTSSKRLMYVRACLNRTFYGIERVAVSAADLLNSSLNRTFYGIERWYVALDGHTVEVLIVPFMELKVSRATRVGRFPSS